LLSVSGMGLTARLSPVGEGEGMGLFTATTALAGVTGAALGGWVAEHWGYQASLVLPVVGVGLGLTLAFGLRPIHYGEHTLKSAEGKGAAAGNG
jgi:predicted MFS family arabinose efflux permease